MWDYTLLEFFTYAKCMYERKEREFKQGVLQTAMAIALTFGSKEVRELLFPEAKQQGSIEELKELLHAGKVST